jgi:hypothetical protein
VRWKVTIKTDEPVCSFKLRPLIRSQMVERRSSSFDSASENGGEEAPWPVLGRAQTRRIEHQMRCGFFLHGLGDERNPISILTAVQTDGGMLVMVARFNQPLAMVSSSSEPSPAIGTLPMVAVGLEEAFLGD